LKYPAERLKPSVLPDAVYRYSLDSVPSGRTVGGLAAFPPDISMPGPLNKGIIT